MIEFTNVVKAYNTGNKALKGISMHMDDGEFVFLVGPSGSGKSTIIKLITGEIQPTEGSVLVNNFRLESIRSREIPYLRRTVGVVFQDFRLIPNKTVYENVAFAMRVIGAREKEIRSRVPYVLELVGLENKGRRHPGELSGGEQQRVAIARALAGKPELLVLDDASSALDYRTDAALRQALRRDMAGVTQIIVAQRISSLRHADLILVLEEGRVIGRGNHSSLLRTCPAYRQIAETQMGAEGGGDVWQTDPA